MCASCVHKYKNCEKKKKLWMKKKCRMKWIKWKFDFYLLYQSLLFFIFEFLSSKRFSLCIWISFFFARDLCHFKSYMYSIISVCLISLRQMNKMNCSFHNPNLPSLVSRNSLPVMRGMCYCDQACKIFEFLYLLLVLLWNWLAQNCTYTVWYLERYFNIICQLISIFKNLKKILKLMVL